MTSTSRYQELDALRGIAALVVVLFHYTLDRPESALGFKFGATGVDLFFIISGFVIFMSISKISRSSDFVINRVSRLYPTYWAAVTFTFLIISLYSYNRYGSLEQVPVKDYLGNMTMFQHFMKIPNLDGPYWTMIIEMIFYIGVLVLFHFKWMRFFKVIAVILSLASVIAANFLYEHRAVEFALDALPLFKYFPLFFAGILFYKIHSREAKQLQNYLLVGFCFVCQVFLFKLVTSNKFINVYEYIGLLTVYFSLFVLFVNNQLKPLVNSVTLYLGKISFALYLTHQYFATDKFSGLIPTLVNKYGMNFWLAALGVALPIALIVASLITYFIEIPLSKNMKQNLLQLRAFFTKEEVKADKAKSTV